MNLSDMVKESRFPFLFLSCARAVLGLSLRHAWLA